MYVNIFLYENSKLRIEEKKLQAEKTIENKQA